MLIDACPILMNALKMRLNRMRNYQKNNYQPDKGVSPLFVIAALLLALLVVEMSWSEVYDYFEFKGELK